MARPLKQGIDYFPLDVFIDQDDKVQMIEAQYGLVGFAIIIKLLMRIYSSNGYYYEWNEREQLLFSRRINVDINTTKNIVNECIKWGLFNQELYEKYQILTSRGIQIRYLEATKRRQEVKVLVEYLLLDNEELSIISNLKFETLSKNINVNNNSINVDNNSKIYDINTQSKVKESKVKKRKEKERGENKLSSPTPSISPIYSIINLWNSKDKLPKIKNITDARAKHIEARLQEHDLDTILEVIERCANSKFLCGQNNRNWIVSFDWLFGTAENFLKVLEGNYDDKNKKFTVPEWYKDYEANLEFSSKQDDYSDEERQKIVEEAKELLLGGKYDFSN